MGYSIMVEFSDAGIKNIMLRFLEKNLTPINQIVNENTLYVRGPTDDVSYTRRSAQNLIGFDFTLSGDVQSRIAYRICYWMIRRTPNAKFWYDGVESWPIPEACDVDGFEPMASMEINMLERSKRAGRNPIILFMHKKLIKQYSQFDKPVKAELIRLTRRYHERNLL